MPWQETCPVRERMKLVTAYAQGEASMSELCRRLGISRKTAYKWWSRYCESGVDGLKDRPSRPLSSPRKTSEEVEGLVVKLRRTYPSWGPRKLRVALEAAHPMLEIPAASTIGEVLKRNGMIERRRRRRQAVRASQSGAQGKEGDGEGDVPVVQKPIEKRTVVAIDPAGHAVCKGLLSGVDELSHA